MLLESEFNFPFLNSPHSKRNRSDKIALNVNADEAAVLGKDQKLFTKETSYKQS